MRRRNPGGEVPEALEHCPADMDPADYRRALVDAGIDSDTIARLYAVAYILKMRREHEAEHQPCAPDVAERCSFCKTNDHEKESTT